MNPTARCPAILQSVVRGTVLGLLATKPMSVYMERNDAARVESWWSSLPPRTITNESLRLLGMQNSLTERQHRGAAVLAHYSYGAAMGAVYSAIVASRATRSSLLRGAGFGLGVWIASYLGWLPMLGSRAAAHHQRRKNNSTMILAHLIWGMTLGVADAYASSIKLNVRNNKANAVLNC